MVAGAVKEVPVVGEVICAAGGEVVPLVTLTPSKVAVERTVLLWLVTASPMWTALCIVIVALPTWVQSTPFAETNPVKVFPVRRSLTQ
jgi:hypothetical protein